MEAVALPGRTVVNPSANSNASAARPTPNTSPMALNGEAILGVVRPGNARVGLGTDAPSERSPRPHLEQDVVTDRSSVESSVVLLVGRSW
jgi:hypothetical protein